jgi:hypothetical protein
LVGPAERDTDGDGVPDISDPFPDDPERTVLPTLTIESPETLTTFGRTPIQVSGTVAPSAQALTVNGSAIPVDGEHWSAQVHLDRGANTVQARMVSADGIVNTASISVVLDMAEPEVTIESHEDGETVHSQPIAVTGLVNDIVRGTVQKEEVVVQVNGQSAQVSNRSYIAEGIALDAGTNTIRVRATDQAGNPGQRKIDVTYAPPEDGGRDLAIVGGQGQTEVITGTLDDPLAVKVVGEEGEPVENKPVVFRVIRGAGTVGVGTEREGRGFIAKTDADGIATTRFKLGRRVGHGSHKVRAQVVGFAEVPVFHATATGGMPDKLSVHSGNNQRGAAHQRLPDPFVVTATDLGANVVADARVAFEVDEGGGQFPNGEQRIVKTTDGDGRASAHLTLGAKKGLDRQRVTATLLDGADDDSPGVELGPTAGFTASAFEPGPPGETAISGVVVDNQDQPIPGVTVRVEDTTRQAVTGDEGKFEITNAPVGPVHLIADGSTADVDGTYPDLSYNITTVSGVDNPLAEPIYMVELNDATKVWAGEDDVTLTHPDVPGFKLEVPAGSVTFPGGSKEGYLSVTQVNANHIPMTPPNGMQPQFIVTIQPTGARFDPPAKLTLPNVDGHPPGAQVEMYSFDHDLEQFVTVGLGTVAEDGTTITSNSGVGVVKAGWHCGGAPNSDGCCTNKDCGVCYTGCNCEEFLPDKKRPNYIPHDCKGETCDGKAFVAEWDKPIDKPENCKKPFCDGMIPKRVPDDSDNPECKKCQNGRPKDDPAKNGNECADGCGQLLRLGL